MKNNKEIRVAIMEFERGWGRKVESIRTFNTLAEANKYVLEFNAKHTETIVPDWYMYAELIED